MTHSKPSRAEGRRTGRLRLVATCLRASLGLWLGFALAAASVAQAASPLSDTGPRNVEALLVLLAGVGVLLLAAGVLAFAIRELRRDAAERRRTYSYRRRGPENAAPPPARSD